MSDFATLRALVMEDAKGIMVDRLELAELLAEVDALRSATPKKKAAKKSTVNKVAAPGEGYPAWLPLDAWNAYLDMRKKIKKPATEYAQTLLLKKLAAFYANDLDPGVILNQSIMNGWQDLYAPKDASTAYRGSARPSVADQNAANNAEAARLLGQPSFYPGDGMTLDMPI